ncbi:MAG: HAD family phosphatase [Treponema sp.]|jgi:HAD superfamily hydrolase (TIGR01509 family)|nr:HAD family phosphatase [Treponema sp.]
MREARQIAGCDARISQNELRELLFRPKGVIFDMDGLMLDTERPLIAAWKRAAGEAGWHLSGEILARTIGIDEPSTRKHIMENCGRDFPYDVIRDSAERVYTAYVKKNGIPLRPGLLALCGYLDSLGIPVAVATSSVRSVALWKLEMAGIGGRFPLLVCGDEVSRGKPAPDIFLQAVELLGKSPAECLGFEDSPVGLRALEAAGIRPVFIRDMVEPPPETLASVWLRLNSLDEAILFIREG